MSDDKDRGCLWLLNIRLQVFDLIDILRFPDDDDLVIGHHRKTPGHVDDIAGIGITAINYRSG